MLKQEQAESMTLEQFSALVMKETGKPPTKHHLKWWDKVQQVKAIGLWNIVNNKSEYPELFRFLQQQRREVVKCKKETK